MIRYPYNPYNIFGKFTNKWCVFNDKQWYLETNDGLCYLNHTYVVRKTLISLVAKLAL